LADCTPIAYREILILLRTQSKRNPLNLFVFVAQAYVDWGAAYMRKGWNSKALGDFDEATGFVAMVDTISKFANIC